MPDLEIPPDLTADAINDSMNIPNEAPATLSRYKKPQAPGTARLTMGTTDTDEQWISVSKPIDLLWPELLEFFEEKNYPIELEDSDLGVLETGWSQASEQTGLMYRHKYKIFAEQGDTPDVSVLIISQQRQTRLDDNADWLDQEKGLRGWKDNLYPISAFLLTSANRPAGARPVAVSDKTAGGSALARPGTDLRVVDAGEGKMYLSIPEAFEQAWKNTAIALQSSGLQVTGGDAAKGVYLINSGAVQSREKKGFFSKLAFWKGSKSVETSYQISLTGVGNRTELIVVNEDDEWETTDTAVRILALIRDRYPIN